MKIYFDESRNTGEIGYKNKKLNYYEQRYFILVGYIDDELITKKYIDFKKKYFNIMYPNSDKLEIKGNDLLVKENNKILDEFIENFIKDDNLLITIYDKKFYLVTSLLTWLFGQVFKDKFLKIFYMFCEFMIKADDELFIEFIKITEDSDVNSIKDFINYLIEYEYAECITTPFENSIKENIVEFLNTCKKSGLEYYSILKDDSIVENIKIKGKNRNHIVNLTALGETIFGQKSTSDLKNKQLTIYHDNIQVVEEYIGHYFKDVNIHINFLDSDDNIQIQLADNVSSIVGKFINTILPIKNDEELRIIIGQDNDWIRERLSKIFKNINKEKVKMVVNLRDQAFLLTYTLSNKRGIIPFKFKLQENLDKRFEIEFSQHINIGEAYKVLKR